MNTEELAEPIEPGGYVGDIFFGHPEKTTLGTHRWNGSEWVVLPSEMEAVLGLLVTRTRQRDNLAAKLEETERALSAAYVDAKREHDLANDQIARALAAEALTRLARTRAEAAEAKLEAVTAERDAQAQTIREMAMQSLADLGQAQEAREAQKAAEAALQAERERGRDVEKALRQIAGFEGRFSFAFPESDPDYASFAVVTAREILARIGKGEA